MCIRDRVKGAAGQAVQNMNLLFGFDEAEGLNLSLIHIDVYKRQIGFFAKRASFAKS